VLASAAVALVLAAPAPAATTVRVRDFAFAPAVARVRRGGRVTWRFLGAARHDVTPRGARRFRAIPARRSGAVSRRFRRTGTYRYVCELHPGMTGRVVVTRR
jgi:plastocyanin